MSEGFTLPKAVAADLLKDAFLGKQRVQTQQAKIAVDGKPPRELALDAQLEFTNSITPALKRMK